MWLQVGFNLSQMLLRIFDVSLKSRLATMQFNRQNHAVSRTTSPSYEESTARALRLMYPNLDMMS
jgi:hypothetical protein